MSESTFRFRHFTIHQDKCAMKVGTDAVLLGSWIRPGLSHRILDIGTGTGILAIMLAQKSGALIDAIDIDEGAYSQARENARISPWFDRIHVLRESFQRFSAAAAPQYDLVVTNPPYFHEASKPAKEARIQARHSDRLPFHELITGVQQVLLPGGRFCIILPSREGMEFLDLAQRNGLFCHRLLRVRTRADRPEKRVLMEFGRHIDVLRDEEIVLFEDETRYTRDYIDLTRNYYIGLK